MITVDLATESVRDLNQRLHDLPPDGPPGEPSTVRPVCFEEWLDTPIYGRAVLAAGQRVAGPAVIEERESTLVVPPGARVAIDATGAATLTLPRPAS